MSESIPKVDFSDTATGCCPRFYPEKWDRKDFSFEGLNFIKAATKSFLYMPLNMDKVMTRTQEAIVKAGAEVKDRYLILSQDVSLWKCEHSFLVSREVPGYEMKTFPGTYYARVFEGPYSQMGAWYQEFFREMKEKGAKEGAVSSFYTTCPKCAKAYGKNYVVFFGRIG